MLEPGHPKRDEVIAHMASAVGTDQAGFLKQMETIDFYTRKEAAALVTSDEFASTLDDISSFAWNKGLLGPTATRANFIGMEFEDDSVQGNKQNVQLRFPTNYMLVEK
jgi:NitT/TauT family transport system substrate-binding protein